MKTKIIKLLAVMLTMFLARDVFAYQTYEGSFYEAEKIKGIYFYKNSSSTEEKPTQAVVYRTTTDRKIVYSIENQEKVKEGEISDYINTKESHPVYLSTEQAKRIEALAYFGYGYQDDDYDHTQPKWYAVTQYLIWKTSSSDTECYFVSSATSKTPIYPYNKEIAELNKILEEKLKKPNFENYESIKNLTLEEPTILIDSNNVLNNYYSLLSSDKISLKKPTSNQIILTAHKEDTYSLYLYRGFMKYGNNYTYYQSDKYPDMIEQGNLDSKSVALIFYGHAKVEENNTENESSKSDNESKEEIESAAEPDSKEEETPEDDEDKTPEGDLNEDEIKQDEEGAREDTNLNDEIESSPELESKEDECPGDDSKNEENKKDDEELKDDNNSNDEIESGSEPDSKEEKNPEDDENSKSDEANKTPEDDSSEDENEKDDNEQKEDDHLPITGGESEKDIPNIDDENTSVSKGEDESKEEEPEENNEENKEDNLENKNETEKEETEMVETGKDSLEEDVNSKEETDETNENLDTSNEKENVDKTEIPNEDSDTTIDKKEEETKESADVSDNTSNSSKELDSLKPNEEENKTEYETIENGSSNNNEIFEDDSKEEIPNVENESEGYQDKESEHTKVPDTKDEGTSLPKKEDVLNPSKDEEKEEVNVPQIEIMVPSINEEQQQIENKTELTDNKKTHLDMLESNINESDYEQVEVNVPATDAFVLSIIFYLLSIIGLVFVKYAK